MRRGPIGLPKWDNYHLQVYIYIYISTWCMYHPAFHKETKREEHLELLHIVLEPILQATSISRGLVNV